MIFPRYANRVAFTQFSGKKRDLGVRKVDREESISGRVRTLRRRCGGGWSRCALLPSVVGSHNQAILRFGARLAPHPIFSLRENIRKIAIRYAKYETVPKTIPRCGFPKKYLLVDILKYYSSGHSQGSSFAPLPIKSLKGLPS